jgi:hypothetical protein
MSAGDRFPPVEIVRDDAANYLAEGTHRLAAARCNRLESIECSVRSGTRRDALLASVSTNATHGKRRTPEEKRRAVLKLLSDPEWSRWSDREIARRCKVSNTFVGKERAALTVNVDSDPTRRVVQFVTKHGETATMDVRNIGRQVPVESWTEGTPAKTIAMERTTEPPATQSVRVVPSFGEAEMQELEKLAQLTRNADKTFVKRLMTVGRVITKTAEKCAKSKAAKPRRN